MSFSSCVMGCDIASDKKAMSILLYLINIIAGDYFVYSNLLINYILLIHSHFILILLPIQDVFMCFWLYSVLLFLGTTLEHEIRIFFLLVSEFTGKIVFDLKQQIYMLLANKLRLVTTNTYNLCWNLRRPSEK